MAPPPPPQILTHPSYVALLARVDDVLTDFADFAKRPQKRWRAGPSSPPLPVSMTSSPTSRRDHRSAGVRDPRRSPTPSPVSMTSSPTSRRDHRSAGVRDPRRPPLVRADGVLTDFAKRPQKRWRAGPSSPGFTFARCRSSPYPPLVVFVSSFTEFASTWVFISTEFEPT
jgi:hypothetical protein